MKTRSLIGIILLIVMIASSVILVYHHPNTENNSREAPTAIPGKALLGAPKFVHPDMVELSVGETKEFNITAETKKNGPGEVTYSFSRVKRVYSDEEISMPDGLKVSIEPSTFMAYPNETYNSIVTVNTSQDILQGKYILYLHTVFENVMQGWGYMTVNVV
ncbi:MAG: hypothetical protein U9N36_10065 [Euryarchaeota archaeon]|nr:hypothetical protein [Euryarchaeota archaeon]